MTEDQLHRLKQLADNAAHEASHLRFSFFRENVEAFIHIVYLKGYIDALEVKPAPVSEHSEYERFNSALAYFGEALIEDIKRIVGAEKTPKKK